MSTLTNRGMGVCTKNLADRNPNPRKAQRSGPFGSKWWQGLNRTVKIML